MITNIGGKERIDSLTPCNIAVHSQLKDECIPKDQILKNITGICTVMKSDEHYELVISIDVPPAYVEMLVVTDSGEESTRANLLNRFIGLIRGSFCPFLGALLCACVSHC